MKIEGIDFDQWFEETILNFKYQYPAIYKYWEKNFGFGFLRLNSFFYISYFEQDSEVMKNEH